MDYYVCTSLILDSDLVADSTIYKRNAMATTIIFGEEAQCSTIQCSAYNMQRASFLSGACF